MDLQGVINFECSEDILTERILERGKTSGRSDDNLESLKKRFATFYNETMPVVQWYEDNQATTGVKVLRIDATKDKETVWGLTKDMVATMPGNAPKGPKSKVLFILGPPGAGKGTQCDNLVKEFDYMHISAGARSHPCPPLTQE